MKKLFLLLYFFFSLVITASAQDSEVEKLKQQLKESKADSSRVILLVILGSNYQYSRPDTCLKLAEEGLFLARQIKYQKGEALCLNLAGVVLMKTGNYPKALKTLFEGLKISEKLDVQKYTGMILTNIATVYTEQNENRQALQYLSKAKTIAESRSDSSSIMNAVINMGDNYEALNLLDSARMFTQQGYEIALRLNDALWIGVALNNLGNIHAKMKQPMLAMEYYRLSLPYYENEQDDEGICSSSMGMAKLFSAAGQTDSAVIYAKKSLRTAHHGGFTKYVLDAANFIASYYKAQQATDSAFAYQEVVMAAKDSLFSQEKVKQLQNVSLEETLRQQELLELQLKANEERKNNLQLMGIGLFIFLFTSFVIVVGKRKTKSSTINFMATVSMLLIFEFISLFIHPYIAHWTHHSPVYMFLILVAIASVLVPMHHKAEHWIKEVLAHKIIHPKTRKLVVKKTT